uniref:DUF4939 domain-containing protein n=1 Tax=Salvator merianae TaxID=96440 RepID=A0A8D0BUD6_SALMN
RHLMDKVTRPLPLLPARGKCRMPVPEKFDGSRDQLPVFLAQTHLFIEQQPQDFPTDSSKVDFLIGLLSGHAISPLLNDLKGFLKSWENAADIHAPDLVHHFHNQYPTKPGPPRAGGGRLWGGE